MKKYKKLLTVIVILCVSVAIAAGMYYYKQGKETRQLSLIYIP